MLCKGIILEGRAAEDYFLIIVQPIFGYIREMHDLRARPSTLQSIADGMNELVSREGFPFIAEVQQQDHFSTACISSMMYCPR